MDVCSFPGNGMLAPAGRSCVKKLRTELVADDEMANINMVNSCPTTVSTENIRKFGTDVY